MKGSEIEVDELAKGSNTIMDESDEEAVTKRIGLT